VDKRVYDLIVVGAGPAGSSAARMAAKCGLDVLVIEKENFPRYKPCGGALSERAVSALDFSLPEDLCERIITGARIHFKDVALEKHKNYPLTTLVTRSRFDSFLLEKAKDAGAQVLTDCRLDDFQEKADHVEVSCGDISYQSRFLALCAGCQSRLKDRISGPETSRQSGVCLVTEIEASEGEMKSRLNEALDIYFGVADGGYGWIFPHRGYYSVGIGGLSSRLKHPRAAMKNFLRENGFSGCHQLHGHTIPLGCFKSRLASGRVLLAGDSAGFVDGFTGEGIFYAIRSGQIAAEIVSENLQVGSKGLPDAYRSRCKVEFGDDLRYAFMLSRLLHSRPDIFFRILTSQEEVLERYIDIATPRTNYREFMRWLLPRLPIRILRAL
jgi:geranylgeranyl reductase family protein